MRLVPKVSRNKIKLVWERKNPKKYGWRANDEKRYDTTLWRKISKMVREEEPFCRLCAKEGITTLTQCADHIVAIRLGGSFWDRENLQGLCKRCNNKKKT